MTTVPSWPELLFLMVHGPDRPMHGRIRHQDGAEERFFAYSQDAGDPEPALAHGSQEVIDVWCWGERFRVADPDGQVRITSDGTTAWTFEDDDEPPAESPRSKVEFVMSGTELLVRTDAERWLGDDFTHPTGPPVATTFLGRDAWEVELAPPAHKPAPMQIVVDAETGMFLCQRNDAFGFVREWTSLTVGDDLDPALFTWTGPVLTWDDQRAQSRREREAEQAQSAQWAAEQLGTRTLDVTLEVELEVRHVQDDGSLHAGLAHFGSLVRRPRSDSAWDEVDGSDRAEAHTHRWSDSEWDWALQTRDPHAPLAPGALAAIQAQLGRDVSG